MLLRLEVPALVHGKLRKASSTGQVACLVEIEVDVLEVSADLAPVALRYTVDARTRDRGALRRSEWVRTSVFRCMEGRFYAEAIGADDIAAAYAGGKTIRVPWLFTRTFAEIATDRFDAATVKWRDLRDIGPRGAGEYARLRHLERDCSDIGSVVGAASRGQPGRNFPRFGQVAEADPNETGRFTKSARKEAERLILCEGGLYAPTGQPVFTVMRSQMPDIEVTTARIFEGRHIAPVPYGPYELANFGGVVDYWNSNFAVFEASQLGELGAEAALCLSKEEGDGRYSAARGREHFAPQFSAIEIALPEAFVEGSLPLRLDRAARLLVKGYYGEPRHWSRRAGQVLEPILEATRSTKVTEEALCALEPALEEAVVVLRDDKATFVSLQGGPCRYEIRDAERTLAEWKERPVSICDIG